MYKTKGAGEGFFRSPAELAAADPLKRPASGFEKYTGPRLTDEIVQAAEATLRVKLPPALIELFRERNGGFLRRRYFRASSLEQQEIEFRQLGGLGWARGLDSETGALYLSQEWGYPAGLLWLEGDGHTGVFLDYRTCGPHGDPSVVWYDTEADDPTPHTLATDFATFLSELREEA